MIAESYSMIGSHPEPWPFFTRRHSLLTVFLLVLALALLVRGWNLSTWSMWEDEEGSLQLAQQPLHGFQGFFPIYFLALNLQIKMAGASVGAARVVPALLGVLSIALTYVLFQRWCSPKAALIACVLLALNLGHVFFSQSVRYYTAALVFQTLSLGWFCDGFERDRPWSLAASLVSFVLALLTHFSALLLVPVFVGYLGLMVMARVTEAGYRIRNYLLFGVPLVLILMGFTFRFLQLRDMVGGWVIPAQRDPIHTALTVAAYFTPALLALATLAPLLARQLPPRILVFLLCGAFIPLAELVVIAQLNIINVTWYYGFIALIPCALLAGSSVVGVWGRGARLAAGALGGVAVLSSALLLGAYHFYWHGDRPRWLEAAEYLREAARLEDPQAAGPVVYTHVPGVVAFYLGAAVRYPEASEIVKPIPHQLAPAEFDGWFVVEAKLVSPAHQAWFDQHCSLRIKFESRTGPVDRSVLVYYCPGANQSDARSSPRSR